jgi:hypothetical protein
VFGHSYRRLQFWNLNLIDREQQGPANRRLIPKFFITGQSHYAPVLGIHRGLGVAAELGGVPPGKVGDRGQQNIHGKHIFPAPFLPFYRGGDAEIFRGKEQIRLGPENFSVRQVFQPNIPGPGSRFVVHLPPFRRLGAALLVKVKPEGSGPPGLPGNHTVADASGSKADDEETVAPGVGYLEGRHFGEKPHEGREQGVEPGDGGKLRRGELTGWTGHDLVQIELACFSPASRNQGIDIHRLKKAVQFIRGLEGSSLDEFLGQLSFSLAGPKSHEHEHRQGT